MMAKKPQMAMKTPSTQKLHCWMILNLSSLRYPQVSSMELVKLPSREMLLLLEMISERFIFYGRLLRMESIGRLKLRTSEVVGGCRRVAFFDGKKGPLSRLSAKLWILEAALACCEAKLKREYWRASNIEEICFFFFLEKHGWYVMFYITCKF